MTAPTSTEADFDALMRLGERLAGFDPALSAEWVDGALTALMAGPRVPQGMAEVVEPLWGDTWSRTFADPDDVAWALSVLASRWRVLRRQLDPEALWDAPDALRLAPLLLAAPEIDTEPAAESEAMSADGAPGPSADDDGPRLGEDWAAGFRAVVDDPAWGWQSGAADDELASALAAVDALCLDEAALADHVRAHHGEGEPPTREQLVDDACFAVQDLRLWWIENAPRTAPRRVEATPGRNDPCPCGSGKKFKKCHGA